MRSLYQRLKELDREMFETFCLHLLKERHPGVQIQHVDGSHGDQGVDIFLGNLEGSPVVWQCKHFPNGVGKSQREQIRLSLKEALRHFHPRIWILCLPIDMDTTAHRWFQRLAHSYADLVEVKLLQGTDLAHELIHRQSLRDRFFPDAVIETMQLREILGKTAELTTEELAVVTADNVDKYLDRLKQRDARFNYEIIFSKDVAPVRHRALPGLLASISDEKKTINVFARDVEAINRNPPKVSFSLKGTGVDKFKDLIETGRAQHFGPDEIVSFSSGLSFILPTNQGSEFHLDIGPSRPQQNASFHTRMTFGSGESAVVYDWMEFNISRMGSEEVELVSKGDLPFKMRMVFRKEFTEAGEISIGLAAEGADVRGVQKVINAIDQLIASRRIELFDLKTSKPFFRATVGEVGALAFDQEFREIVADCVIVADHYGVSLALSKRATVQELRTLSMLAAMARNVAQEVANVEMTLTKSMETTPEVRQLLRSPGSFMMTQVEMLPRPVLFGVEVPTGRVVWHLERATIRNAKLFERRLSKAAIGDTLKLSLSPQGPLRIRALGKTGGLVTDPALTL
jgi:hypothetical protein